MGGNCRWRAITITIIAMAPIIAIIECDSGPEIPKNNKQISHALIHALRCCNVMLILAGIMAKIYFWKADSWQLQHVKSFLQVCNNVRGGCKAHKNKILRIWIWSWPRSCPRSCPTTLLRTWKAFTCWSCQEFTFQKCLHRTWHNVWKFLDTPLQYN